MSRPRTSGRPLFVNLLGRFQVAGPHAADILLLERKKTRALLAMLALDLGQMVPRGKITALLWAEQSEDAARHALRQCLLDLRHVLAKANLKAIRVEADLIGLEPSRVVVDTARFEHQITRGTPEALQGAVALYCGDLLEGFSINESAFEDWLRAERERLRSQAVTALKKLLRHHAKKNVTDAAIQVAIRLLVLEPFDEAVHRALMRLYAESGRWSAALRQYETCVEVLARELSVEPDPETRSLFRRLVSERTRLAAVPVIPSAHTTSGSEAAQAALSSPSPTPLVGREVELDWLESILETCRTGQPTLALVIGEAGIGKSRVIDEFASRVQDRRADIMLGRGREGEDVLPFAPWVEALRTALSKELLGRLPAANRVDLARLFPEITEGPGPPPSGLEDGPRIFEAVAHLLRELAVRRPLVVIIEDLHWCDDMTVRLLRFLPRRLEGHPVLLVGTTRAEELEGGSARGTILDALRRDISCSSRTLGALSREEAMQVFRALLASSEEAPSAVLTDRMWTLSEGNPFVVVAWARAVRDRGAAGPDGSLQLPDQVRALTARCFADLSPQAGRLADVAAVIGRDFDVAVVRNAAALTESDMADVLEELVRRRVLREANGRFDFGHDRLREVRYADLLGPRRALLHRQVAEGLEAVYATELDRHCAAIGTHYRDAGVWDHASTYLARAGFQAWGRGAGREALTCFEDALQVINRLPDTEERRELHVHLRIAANGAHVALGSYERGRPHLLAAEKLAGTLSDRRWEGRVAVVLCNSLRAGGMPEPSLAVGRRALEIAREIGDHGLESAGRLVLGTAEENAGNLRRALTHLLSLVNDDTSGPDLPGPFLSGVDRLQALRATAHHWIAVTCVELGEFGTGLRLVNEFLRETETVSDALGTARLLGLIALGRLRKAAGDFDAAIQAYEAARAIYRDDCHVPFSRALIWGLGLAYALAGRVAEGIELLERADAAEHKIGSRSFRPMRMLHIGRALVEAGRIDEAADRANDALTFALEDRKRTSEAGALGLLGEVAGRRDPVPYEEMEHHLLGALALAEPLEMRPLVARCHLRLAWLYSTTGRADGARHSAAAESLLCQMGRPRSLDAAAVH